MFPCHTPDHTHRHAFTWMHPRERDGLTFVTRRSTLKAGALGFAGLTLPRLLEGREVTAKTGEPVPRGKAVILIWMTGGPSHIDTWDVKPDAPSGIRGPFGVIKTKLPGVLLCEYLPKQAAMMDKLTIIRSMDPRGSNHEPNQVMQTGHREAAPRVNPKGPLYPAIGSVIAKMRGANDASMPPYVALNMKSRSHLAWGGYLGKQYDPFLGDDVSKLLKLPAGLDPSRLKTRRSLRQQFDQLHRDLDLSGSMEALDRFGQQAIDIVAGARAQAVFDLSQEKEATLERYGDHDWSQKALLARRLVEAGVSFVTIDLSHHGASGTWDTHGDNIPPYGGIWNGLRPLLPVFDHLFTTLISDLEERGLLDDVLVIAMGEFGRTPRIGTQGSTDGRNHWPNVSAITLAGGGFRHGQVIGATERDAGHIKERPVTPADLAATIYHHMGVPLDATYLDHRGRPHFIVQEGGEPIRELL